MKTSPSTLAFIKKEIVMREATSNIKLETTYCTKCHYNGYQNIGSLNCQKCGGKK